MRGGRLSFVSDVWVADWLGPRLGPFGGWVGSVVPRGFEAYARVLHPVYDGAGQRLRWAQVCAVTGRVAHPLMQWQAIAAPAGGGGATAAGQLLDPPEQGRLDPDEVAALCEVLDGATPGVECVMALWEGYGWIHGSPAVAVFTATGDGSGGGVDDAVAPAFPPEVMTGPRLRLPGRGYLLFRGPVHAAADLGWSYRDWFQPQPPNLMWPADRSWFVASEIDFDSTLVAGPRELIDEVLRDPRFDAWPVGPDDDLSLHGDTLNQPTNQRQS